jgi:carboxymethylenebutenolidase
MPNVEIPTTPPMPCWLAEPAAPGPHPAVVVIHDIFGMCQDHRDQAGWLADAGFLALSIDLYHRGGRLKCVREVMRELMARKGRSFQDVEAARAWLANHPHSNGRMGVMGFCMGGGFALLLACGRGFDASAVNYGGPLPPDVDEFLGSACAIVGSYGGQMKREQGAVIELGRKLDALGIANDVKEYPDAGHGFMNRHGPIFGLLRFMGVGPNPDATADARRRIVAFFRTHLG